MSAFSLAVAWVAGSLQVADVFAHLSFHVTVKLKLGGKQRQVAKSPPHRPPSRRLHTTLRVHLHPLRPCPSPSRQQKISPPPAVPPRASSVRAPTKPALLHLPSGSPSASSHLVSLPPCPVLPNCPRLTSFFLSHARRRRRRRRCLARTFAWRRRKSSRRWSDSSRRSSTTRKRPRRTWTR